MPTLFSLAKNKTSSLKSAEPSDLEIVISVSSVVRNLKHKGKEQANIRYKKWFNIINIGEKKIRVLFRDSLFQYPEAILDSQTFHRDIENGTVSTDPKYTCKLWMRTMVKPGKVLLPLWNRRDSYDVEILPGTRIGTFTLGSGPQPPRPASNTDLKGRELPARSNIRSQERKFAAAKCYPVRMYLDFSGEDWKAGKVDLESPDVSEEELARRGYRVGS